MFMARKVFGVAKLLLVLAIIGNIVGLFQFGMGPKDGGEVLARYVGPPLSVRFIGALHPPDQKNGGGSRAIKVLIERQKWIFDIEEIVILGSGSVTELKLLQALRPYSLLLGGPEEVLSVLKRPEIIGKPLSIKGYLYINHHRLMVDSIDAGPGEER